VAVISEAGRLRDELVGVMDSQHERIADQWVRGQAEAEVPRPGLAEDQLRDEAEGILRGLRTALARGRTAEAAVRETPLRDELAGLSRVRAQAGVSAAATASAILRLKGILLDALRAGAGTDAARLLGLHQLAGELIDAAAIVTFQYYLEGRDEIIRRQSNEMMELSTPVVRLWRNVLAVPLVGTLDSSRAQMVMESLLTGIQAHEAKVAILDITGVPTVDTVVAQHLMQTVAAARLMGADCVISGIRPQIAQTMAQLGIDLSAIMTRASLADALSAAITMVTEGQAGDGDASDLLAARA
jgi:rsbT co-antagonist protein RsbR